MMHQNSLFAIQQQRDSGKLSQREQLILQVLENDTLQHLGRTDRMIMTKLGFTDPNAVRPRITEMIEKGWLEECGSTKDPATGMTVRRVRIKKAMEQYPD